MKTKKKIYTRKTRKGGLNINKLPTNITKKIVENTINLVSDQEIINKANEIYSTYLSNVNIDKTMKMFIMEKSFGSTEFFIKLHNRIKDYLPTTSKRKWVNCINDCFDVCNKYVVYETGTTAYMLRALSNSIIGDKSYTISFKIINNDLNGQWTHDKQYIQLESNSPNLLHHGRLIMGFGPSASGKTYCANKVIELMTVIDPSFPKIMISIDGGIYRESSVVYQTIINEITSKGLYDGISNLVSSTIFGKQSIFKSDRIKKSIKLYLKDQHKYGFIVNLYVPETLGGCIGNINCKMKITDYINITGDHNWVGLLIYQHKTPDACPYHEKYRCVGTIENGKSREIVEGKKYNSTTWKNSYDNGKLYMNRASNYRFRIHNSGNENTSIFEDLSVNKLKMSESLIDLFKKNNWLYIDGDIKYYNKCKLFRDDC